MHVMLQLSESLRVNDEEDDDVIISGYKNFSSDHQISWEAVFLFCSKKNHSKSINSQTWLYHKKIASEPKSIVA